MLFRYLICHKKRQIYSINKIFAGMFSAYLRVRLTETRGAMLEDPPDG